MTAETLSKGVQATAQRAALLPVRYGLGKDRIRQRLMSMAAVLERWELRPTVPTTAIILERHPEIATALRDVDVAIHGYRHISYAGLSPEKQAEDLDAARTVFARHGFHVRGFRAPYLRPNRFTMDLLRKRDFLFDSSVPHFILPPRHPIYLSSLSLSTARYGSGVQIREWSPRDGRTIEIPVSLPDDEILVDGLGLRRPSTLWSVFESMLQAAQASESLLVLQIHPERFHICKDAIELLLQRASDLGAWKASLSDLAQLALRGNTGPRHWPHGASMALCVTGDIDALTLGDFASRVLGA